MDKLRIQEESSKNEDIRYREFLIDPEKTQMLEAIKALVESLNKFKDNSDDPYSAEEIQQRQAIALDRGLLILHEYKCYVR